VRRPDTWKKLPLARPGNTWEINTIIYLKGMRWVIMERINLAQDRNKWQALVETVMNLSIPPNDRNILTS
jgi:hypothetical protein